MATDKACDLYVLSVVNTIHQGLTDWGGWGGGGYGSCSMGNIYILLLEP